VSTHVLPPRAYRWVDRLTKLGGVALVAAGLEAGGATVTGVALGTLGAAFALATVFVTRAESTADRPGTTAPTEGSDESNRAGTTTEHDGEIDV